MNLKDFTQLKGLMALTASDNDAEALGALRAANRLLVKNGLTWEMVFKRTVTVVAEVEEDPSIPADDDENQRLFEDALRGTSGGFRATLMSIKSQYDTNGSLSEKQWTVIRNAVERNAERAPTGRWR